MAVLDVYFFALHEPYRAAEHSVPINATVVHSRTLLHRAVPQPVGGLMYRCLTEFPGRRPGCVVPLSTLTYELNGDDGWDRIGNWAAVVDALVRLSRERRCDAMPLGLPDMAASLLAHGPTTNLTVFSVGAASAEVGPVQRQHQLDQLTDAVRAFVAQGPFWPGDDLVSPPREPATLPYQPWTPVPR